MKKLLFQLDTDPIPSSFDTVVAYDAGADQVIAHGGVNPGMVQTLVAGTLFTRPKKQKQYTALFVGGSDMQQGVTLCSAIESCFFQDFRVSMMLDSNGSNTTAAAAARCIVQHTDVHGKKAVVLAGTGPVGQRTAALLAQAGAQVVISSRQLQKVQRVCETLQQDFDVAVEGRVAEDDTARGALLADTAIVCAAGRSGVQLLAQQDWQDREKLQVLVDVNAVPPLGIAGVPTTARGQTHHEKIVWGALGIGPLKMAIHKACIARLFSGTDHVLDATTIFDLARTLS